VNEQRGSEGTEKTNIALGKCVECVKHREYSDSKYPTLSVNSVFVKQDSKIENVTLIKTQN
jgi:hypothetical protein